MKAAGGFDSVVLLPFFDVLVSSCFKMRAVEPRTACVEPQSNVKFAE